MLKCGHFTHNHSCAALGYFLHYQKTGENMQNCMCGISAHLEMHLGRSRHTQIDSSSTSSCGQALQPSALRTLIYTKLNWFSPIFWDPQGSCFQRSHIPSFTTFLPWALINTGGISTALCSISGHSRMRHRLIILPGHKKATTKPLIC